LRDGSGGIISHSRGEAQGPEEGGDAAFRRRIGVVEPGGPIIFDHMNVLRMDKDPDNRRWTRVLRLLNLETPVAKRESP